MSDPQDPKSRNGKKEAAAGVTETEDKSKSRRRFVSGLGVGTVASVGAATGTKWVKPVVESVVLPAHAQTTGPSRFSASIRILEEDTSNPNYQNMLFRDGVHTIDGFTDVNDIDDPSFEFVASFDPPLASPVPVTMNLVADTDFDFGDISTDEQIPTNVEARFTTLSSDEGVDDPAEITAVFSAPGFPTRRVRLIFNP